MKRPQPDIRLSADREIVPRAKAWRWLAAQLSESAWERVRAHKPIEVRK